MRVDKIILFDYFVVVNNLDMLFLIEVISLFILYCFKNY